MSEIIYFEKGREYQRKRLHDRYDGQRQGGISTPSNYPIIMLFDTSSGSEYGYRDGFTKDGIFEWTGEGQIGTMELTGGNKAIYYHQENGEKIHLFRETRPGIVKYFGEMVSLGYFLQDGEDKDGNLRKLIIFNLAPVETPKERLEELRNKTQSQTIRAPKKKPERILLCQKCSEEYTFDEFNKIRFCEKCGTYLTRKIRYE